MPVHFDLGAARDGHSEPSFDAVGVKGHGVFLGEYGEDSLHVFEVTPQVVRCADDCTVLKYVFLQKCNPELCRFLNRVIRDCVFMFLNCVRPSRF